jgi:[ribosomal protein S18]-alanine N-acetyltransferase
MSDARVRAMRWWDIEPTLELEQELFSDDAWSAALFWSELAQYDTRYYLVAEDDDRLVGYGGLAVLGPEAYVQTVGVTRTRWGEGLGTVLVHALLAEADRRGAEQVVLEVRADNVRAQRLYERFGFATVGVRKGYYQPSGADAHVMVRSAS